jgi:tight adherence protein B
MNLSPLLIIGVGGVLALLLLIIGIAVSVRRDRSLVDERLEKYADKTIPVEERDQSTGRLTTWIDQRVAGSSLGDRIRRNLSQADIKMKSGEYLALLVILVVLIGLFGYFLGNRSIVLAIAGGVLGFFLPGMYVNSQKRRRLVRFNDQLSDMLNLVVNGLRAGYSTMQAMESVSKELPSPISDEFRRVVQEMQLGVSMEKALENLLRRIPSDDLDLIITAINVQREVGGNLAEILDTISYTIRERVRIKGEIRVLTTQVMYSGRFLAFMPLIVIGILYLVNRPYMMEFFKESSGICGYIALGVSLVLIILGYIAMNKLADIEV